jgi:hypothetical protein
MDYLLIGTEGSDYEILKICNLVKYKISTITVNQGFAKNRENIFNLLTSTIINGIVSIILNLRNGILLIRSLSR